MHRACVTCDKWIRITAQWPIPSFPPSGNRGNPLVDDKAEQEILESILEDAKPAPQPLSLFYGPALLSSSSAGATSFVERPPVYECPEDRHVAAIKANLMGGIVK